MSYHYSIGSLSLTAQRYVDNMVMPMKAAGTTMRRAV